MKAKLGIAPIAWWNDDLEELSDDVSLQECLRQASVAGFTGMETGRRFPMDMDELGPLLTKHSMSPLATKPKLTEAEIAVYGRKVSDFADWCLHNGMPLAYHHHMAAVIETEDELDLLMKHSSVPLLFDTGHMAFAGGDVLRVIEKHHNRISHVHVKDVRRNVIDEINREQESFLDAVVKGAFTVPGDGSLDFEGIVKALAANGYEGWFVVEAEQNPKISPPLEMAKKGHKELIRVMALSGYAVE